MCDGNVSKKCNDGTIETVKDCATENPAQVCLASTGACGVAPVTSCTDTAVGTVEDGKTVCKENNVYTCNNTQLSKTTDCTVTDAESAAHLVSVCTPGEQGANATCVKKCAEDYKFGEGANANKCVAAHDQQCKINTVGGKQVAQYRTAESGGGYTDWNNCAKDDFSIYGCKENKECELTGCADTHEIATIDGEKVCVKKKVNNCGNDVDGNKAETDSAYCVSDTQYAMCLSDGQNVYTSTEPITCSATYKCINSKANELNGCACTATTAPACTIKASGAYISTCNPETGKLVDEKCPMPDNAKSTVCSADKCDFECKTGLIKNQAGTDCVECTDPTATKCPDKRYCSANGKCTPLGTTACTADVCRNGFINYCKGDDGAKKYADAVSCIENGVGICAEGGTACTTDVKSCNVNYIKVDNACKKYDTVECTTGVCTDSHYFGCPAATEGAAMRYHSAPVEKPAVDANGTWACDVDNGWTLTCTDTDLYEVKDGKCVLKAGKCKADADCSGDTPKCDVASNTCVAAPAPECAGDAIQCVDETKYKTCTAEGSWDTTEKTVDAGLKCEANSLKCIAESGCVGNISYVCEDGESIIENCEDKSEVCDAGACVAGGTTPAPNPTAWVDVVAYTATQLKTGNYAKCVGIDKNNGEYLNCGHFGKDFDPSKAYIKYALTDADIQQLQGKTWIAADITFATQDKSNLKKVNYQFFSDGSGIGSVGSIELNDTTQVNVEKYNSSITSTTNLELRMWPDPSEATGAKSLVRLYSLKLYAQ